MQVRHRTTDTVYAMKILKKSELRRRKQVRVVGWLVLLVTSVCREIDLAYYFKSTNSDTVLPPDIHFFLFLIVILGGAHADGAHDPGERAPPFHRVSALRLPIPSEALHGHGLRAGNWLLLCVN